MSEIPTLETARLQLRPFTLDDAPAVRRLAGERAIASTTLNIPHPYDAGVAEAWIAGHAAAFAEGRAISLALTHREDGALLGGIGLRLVSSHRRAELGYWLGIPYWGQGYATEAAAAVLGYGFTVRDLNRIEAIHMTRNPASGRVMQKLGMRHEGRLRQHDQKWGVFEDVEIYAILRSEWAPG